MRRLAGRQVGRKDILEIGSTSCAHAALFRGRVDAHEDEIGLLDTLIDLCRKEKVPTARFTDNGLEAGFIDRKVEVWRVPSGDTVSVEVDNGHFDVWTFDRDDGASWTTCGYRWSEGG